MVNRGSGIIVLVKWWVVVNIINMDLHPVSRRLSR